MLLLLERGADPNLTGGEGTLLLMAAQQGDTPLVEALLDRGASPTALSDGGSSALALAVEQPGRAALVRVWPGWLYTLCLCLALSVPYSLCLEQSADSALSSLPPSLPRSRSSACCWSAARRP